MAQVHRFHNKVAVWLENGETVYLTPKEAKAIALAMQRAALNCGAVKFTDSTFETFNIELSN